MQSINVTHNTYSIEAVDENGTLLKRIEDSCLDKDDVVTLADRMNRGGLSPCHFLDVVEDFLD